MLIEVVEHHLGYGITLEHNDQALSCAARCLIPDIGNSGEFSVLNQVCNLDSEVVRVYLIGKLGNHQARSTLDFFYGNNGTHRDRSTAGAIRILNSAGSQNLRAGGEIRALNLSKRCLKKLFSTGVGMSQVPLCSLSYLAKIVGWDVGCHSHGNSD